MCVGWAGGGVGFIWLAVRFWGRRWGGGKVSSEVAFGWGGGKRGGGEGRKKHGMSRKGFLFFGGRIC